MIYINCRYESFKLFFMIIILAFVVDGLEKERLVNLANWETLQ